MRVSFSCRHVKTYQLKKFLCRFSGTLLLYSAFSYIIRICETIYISLQEDIYEIKFY